MPAPQGGFDQTLEGIGAAIGVDLSPDENGVITLTAGDDVAVSIETPEDSPFVYFHSAVKRLAGLDRTAALEAAMNKNMFGLSLSTAWLGLDAAEDQIILCYSIPREGLKPDTFASTVEAIAGTVRELRLEQDRSSAEGFSDAERSGGDSDFIRI